MNVIAVFPDLAASSRHARADRPAAEGLAETAAADAAGPPRPLPAPSPPASPRRSSRAAVRRPRRRQQGEHRLAPPNRLQSLWAVWRRPEPRNRQGGQWTAVTLLAAVAAAVWATVLVSERQPVPSGGSRQSASSAAFQIASDRPPADASGEPLRQ